MSQKFLAFIQKVAEFKKFGEPDENGEPYEPSDGVDDSHACLMNLIDEAREIIKKHKPPPEPIHVVKASVENGPSEYFAVVADTPQEAHIVVWDTIGDNEDAVVETSSLGEAYRGIAMLKEIDVGSLK